MPSLEIIVRIRILRESSAHTSSSKTAGREQMEDELDAIHGESDSPDTSNSP